MYQNLEKIPTRIQTINKKINLELKYTLKNGENYEIFTNTISNNFCSFDIPIIVWNQSRILVKRYWIFA